MKYIDGIFKIAIGVAFIFLRVIETINYQHVNHLSTRLNREGEIYIDLWGKVYFGEEYIYTIHTYSFVPLILAALFILWGVLSLIASRVKKV